MPIAVFELCCCVVIAVTLVVLARTRGARQVAWDYVPLAAAAWLGEETCIGAYSFYRYADAWHVRVLDVPVLVPLIWPLVILSARDVVRALWSSRAEPLLVGAAVVFDASLVEVLSVRAGLWSWAEPGHLGVPLIGMLGWGYFAAASTWFLRSERPSARAALLVAAPLLTHAAILATWWGWFRWVLRGELGTGSMIGLSALSGAVTATVLLARGKGRGVSRAVWAPRVAATALFLGLLLLTAARDKALWLHLLCVAAPYFASIAPMPRSGRTVRTSL